MYKSINQYHVVLALQQQWWESPDFLKTIYVQTPRGHRRSAVDLRAFHAGNHAAFSCRTRDSFRRRHFRSIWRRAWRSATRWPRSTGRKWRWACRPASPASSPARRRPIQEALANQPILICTALLAVYIVLGMLYESLIHPLTIISTLPSAGVGALMAMVLFKSELDIIAHDRHHPADRHREEERDHDDRFRAGGGAQRRA